MRQQQTNAHGHSAQVRRDDPGAFERLASGRGRQRTLFGPADGAGLDVHVIELEAGSAEGQYHVHPTSETIYVVLAGTVVARHPDGRAELSTGDAARFPAGLPHAASAGPAGARILEIYSPPTSDFILVDDPHGSRAS
jgi:uncharacterized cupin superfamily protein